MAPPIDPPTHITLRIKVPPGHIPGDADTYPLPSGVAVTTKLGELRELIQTSLPSNPSPERQRLLYAGRALVDNDQTIATALNVWRDPTQTEYVVHLLVREGRMINNAQAATIPNGTWRQQQQEQPPPPNAPAQQTLPPPNVPAQQPLLPHHVPLQQTPPPHNIPRPHAHPHPHPGPHPGPPRTQNFFVQAVGPNGERISVHHQQHFIHHQQHFVQHHQHLPPGVLGMHPQPPNAPVHLNPHLGLAQRQHHQSMALPARSIRVPAPPNPNEDVTCYLLSDPSGIPQALLMTPQHGTFTGTLANNSPTPQPIPAPRDVTQMERGNQAAQEARRVPANGNVDGVNPAEFIIRPLWLLLRIMVFGYVFLGSSMGWRRPLALGAIGLAFYLMNAGMLGNGGIVRGWWDGIVREGAAAVQPVRNAGEMPTPEEVARRLLEERRRGESEWMRWGRERLRAVVLLLASLWPGVGEAFVRAREAEDRRVAEEQVAEGRRSEEEAASAAAAQEEAENNGSGGRGVVDGNRESKHRAESVDDPAIAGTAAHGAEAAVVEKSAQAAPSSSTPSA